MGISIITGEILHASTDMDDKGTRLIERLKSNNTEAFKTLLEENQSMVMNICYRFLMNREDAEDISQEVFIEVFRSVKSFRGNAKLSTWIYRIAVTKCLDELKKRRRQKRITSIGKLLSLDFIQDSVFTNQRPDHELESKERVEHIMRILDSLPDNQRAALVLSKIEGYSNAEIAEILDTSLSAAESLISRGKKKAIDLLLNAKKNEHGA